MRLSVFLQLVEIKTKVASIIPFIVGSLFAVYRYDEFNFEHMIVMLLSLLCIDLATTTINNYMDYKRAIKKHGFNFESHNAIVKYQLSEKTVVITIVMLLLVSAVFGLYLVYITDVIVLLIGMLSFAVGVLYSFGPLPISRTPLGEVFSGFFMGCIILFMATYVHIYDQSFIGIELNKSQFLLSFAWVELLSIGLLSLPMVLCISNIMLANNICDVEDDVENKRFTLPIYIGKAKALFIFKWSYLVIIPIYIILVVSGIMPIYLLVMLGVFIPITKFIKIFEAEQSKEKTFEIAVKSMLLIGLSLIVTLVLGIVI